MIWRLGFVIDKYNVNQTALAKEIIKHSWPNRTVRGLAKDISDQSYDVNKLLWRRDLINWYVMYRSYLNVTAMELTGRSTDEEAVAALLEAKIMRLVKKHKDIKVSGLRVEGLPNIVPMPPEIIDKYMDNPFIYRDL